MEEQEEVRRRRYPPLTVEAAGFSSSHVSGLHLLQPGGRHSQTPHVFSGVERQEPIRTLDSAGLDKRGGLKGASLSETNQEA